VNYGKRIWRDRTYHKFINQKNMNMSIDSVISNTVNNILIGDMFLSVRNAEGQEIVQPERLEKIYTHTNGQKITVKLARTRSTKMNPLNLA
jgi:hypothetical protein